MNDRFEPWLGTRRRRAEPWTDAEIDSTDLHRLISYANIDGDFDGPVGRRKVRAIVEVLGRHPTRLPKIFLYNGWSPRHGWAPLAIRHAIENTGATMATLAKQWGCFSQELSMCIWRAGKGREYPELRAKLAAFLGVSLKELFGEPDAESRAAA